MDNILFFGYNLASVSLEMLLITLNGSHRILVSPPKENVNKIKIGFFFNAFFFVNVMIFGNRKFEVLIWTTFYSGRKTTKLQNKRLILS